MGFESVKPVLDSRQHDRIIRQIHNRAGPEGGDDLARSQLLLAHWVISPEVA
jgi:hypothetical protein